MTGSEGASRAAELCKELRLIWYRLCNDDDPSRISECVEELVECGAKALRMDLAPKDEVEVRWILAGALFTRARTKEDAIELVQERGVEAVPDLDEALDDIEVALRRDSEREDEHHFAEQLYRFTVTFHAAWWWTQNAEYIARTRGPHAAIDYLQLKSELLDYLGSDSLAQVWEMLGRLYTVTDQPELAREAFERASHADLPERGPDDELIKSSRDRARLALAGGLPDEIMREGLGADLGSSRRQPPSDSPHESGPQTRRSRFQATCLLLAFAAGSGAAAMLVLTLVSRQPLMGTPGFLGVFQALLVGGITSTFLGMLFHVSPFRQIMRLGARFGKAEEGSGGFGCIGFALLPFVCAYYILSWPGIKLGEKLRYYRFERNQAE